MNKLINKKYLIFVLIILVMGILSGILYYYSLTEVIKDNIINTMNEFNINNINNIIRHLVILSIITVSSFLIVGSPLSLFLLYYEGISIGFIITLFTILYGEGGFLYGVLYTIIVKGIYLFLLLIFIKKIFNISKLIVNNLASKKDTNYKDKLIFNIKNIVYIITFIAINDIIIYIFSGKMLVLLDILMKK